MALRLHVSNWRWAGVPFYLRTGKQLARKVTEIAVTLKPVPHLAFQSSGSVGVQPNQIILTLQPDEGVSVSLGAKIPGARMRIRPVNMEFRYGTSFLSESPEAYERLILDAMRGDATLFTRNDEIEALWGIIDPILTAWHEDTTSPVPQYPAGSAGPAEADALARRRPEVAPAVSEDVWSERDTNPDAIEAALREMLRERHAANQALAPARVLNLVVVVDRSWKGEIANRLERVGRYHASRTILCAVEENRDTLDAVAVMSYEDAGSGRIGVMRETVEVDMGPEHLSGLETIVDPIVISELPTVLWCPHGHEEAVSQLRGLTDVMLLDSDDLPDADDGLARAQRRARLRVRGRPRVVADDALARATWRLRSTRPRAGSRWRRSTVSPSVTSRARPRARCCWPAGSRPACTGTSGRSVDGRLGHAGTGLHERVAVHRHQARDVRAGGARTGRDHRRLR